MECDGNGYCLTVRGLVCTFGCVLQECPNYFLCKSECPQFILDFNQGVCSLCIASFGNCIENPTPSNPILARVTTTTTECPICLTQGGEGALGPRCGHYLCTACIRALYMDDDTPLPPFPIPAREEEYFCDPALFLNDVQIREWKKVVGSWTLRRMLYRAQHRPYLKHCPLCRK